MAKVRAFSVDGIDLWLWSDNHHPPHFHASRPGEWEVRALFLRPRGEMIEIVWPPNATIKRKYRDAIESAAEFHRIRLLQEWHDSH